MKRCIRAPLPWFARTLSGIRLITAGRKASDRAQAAAIPAAVILPRSWNGGASEKFMLRKPTMIVMLVIVTASAFIRMLSFNAEILSIPTRIRPS